MKNPVTASLEQLTKVHQELSCLVSNAYHQAFAKLVRPEETVENFQSKVVEVLLFQTDLNYLLTCKHVQVVDKCTRRAQHASKQISILSPALTKLHEACEGSSKSLFEVRI